MINAWIGHAMVTTEDRTNPKKALEPVPKATKYVSKKLSDIQLKDCNIKNSAKEILVGFGIDIKHHSWQSTVGPNTYRFCLFGKTKWPKRCFPVCREIITTNAQIVRFSSSIHCMVESPVEGNRTIVDD